MASPKPRNYTLLGRNGKVVILADTVEPQQDEDPSGSISVSQCCPLTTNDLLMAIRERYQQSRKLLLKVAAKHNLLSSITPWGKSYVILKGPPLLLDHALSDILQYFRFNLSILDAQTWKPRIRRNHSKSAKDWNDFWRIQRNKLSTDPRINAYLSRADRAFLKWNNDLKTVLVRPLTDCMVNGCTLDYIDIIIKTQNIHEEVMTYFKNLQSVIYKLSNEYMEEELINWLGADWEQPRVMRVSKNDPPVLPEKQS
ncbi:hypothetical protein BELL_0012g00200 [Botrytis elliptica]|uniref:Uncharacterized protein n=1 Tax=Botrytis elliptica TaxID=278938 RepID=A0A4Z1K272_9HELO|nr:hypothetical protein BELL_0012g00200 [Botrytis elliptica]